MAVDTYSDAGPMHRTVDDTKDNANLAKTLATLALVGAIIALAFSVMAWNKANDAIGKAQSTSTQSQGL
jgi:hypothetical protein